MGFGKFINIRQGKALTVMGAVVLENKFNDESEPKEQTVSTEETNERFFRPSKLKALNVNKEGEELINKYFNTTEEYIKLPEQLFKKPWDVIINYYSVLREANYMEEGKRGGCGTVGWENRPYPIAYSFLSTDYRKNMSFKAYVESFKGISHINLVKLRNISDQNTDKNEMKYFIELEVLSSSKEGNTYFKYYYGYVYLTQEEGLFKISNVELLGEDFFCAPYHGWRYYAESYVDVTYGNWCKLIEKRLPTVSEGYIKNIDIKGTDGKDYRFQFVQLTNGVDIEIGQYIKNKDNKWQAIKIDPEKCLEKR